MFLQLLRKFCKCKARTDAIGLLWTCRPKHEKCIKSKQFYCSIDRCLHSEINSELDILQSKSLQSSHQVTKLYLQVLGSAISGNSRSLYVFTDNERFLFNFGDGSLRLCTEFKSKPFTKLNKLFGVFFTSVKHDNIPGIIDLREYLLSLKIEVCSIYCPTGIQVLHKVDKGMKESVRTACSLEVKELIDDGSIESSLSIRHIPIFLYGDSKLKYRNYVLAYVCRPKSNLVRMLKPDKLAHYKVKEEHLRRALKGGIEVTLPSGEVVSPQDVSSITGDHGRSFLVLDIPSKDYLESLVACEAFRQYQYSPSLKAEDCLEVIIHFSSTEVLSDERFIKWISLFPSSVSHLLLNETSGGVDLVKAASFQKRLNFFFPQIFPLPFCISNDESLEANKYTFSGPSRKAQSGLRYILRPQPEFDESLCANISSLDPSTFNESIFSEYRNLIEGVDGLKANLGRETKEYPHIYFLGTGSTHSMAVRNSSSILVRLSEESSFLMDCGAGALCQMRRLFGFYETERILRTLKLIFVSHNHLDHFLGISSLLSERERLFSSPINCVPKLYILASDRVVRYIQTFVPSFLSMENIQIVINERCSHENNYFDQEIHEKICEHAQITRISTAQVPHTEKSFGVAFTLRDGKKIVYSGDTPSSDCLIDIGKNCHLLIHEATFEDGLEHNAFTTRHSTISQAIDVGKFMGAKYIILTHFSQRYSAIPFKEGGLPDNVGIAFDNMKVSLSDLPFLSQLYPFFTVLFHEKWEKMKETNWKRELKEKKAKRFLNHSDPIYVY